MKRLIVTLILASTVLLGASPKALFSRQEVIEKGLRSIVKIEHPTHDEDGDPDGTYLCTGFYVNSAKGQAITARHCVDPNEEVFVDGEKASVLKLSDNLALIAVHPMEKPPLEVGEIRPGEDVVSLGLGYGFLQVMPKTVSAIIEKDDERLQIKKGNVILQGALAPGMSGGPTLNMRGEVIGINQGSNAAISVLSGAEEIKSFLKGK